MTHKGRQHHICITVKLQGEDAGETGKADGEVSFTSSVLGSSLPKWRCFQGSEHWLQKKGHHPEPVSFPDILIPAPAHCLKAASAESRGLCNSYEPVSRPENTSFISYKCLSPSSSNMLRVTTFSASWGSCPLYTVITHSIKAVSKPSFSALFSWPFAADQWKGEQAASLQVQSHRHLGFHLEMDDDAGGKCPFLLPPFLSWKQV